MRSERTTKRYTEEEAISCIKERVEPMNFEFMGFDGEYVNTQTKAFFRCKKCGYINKLRTDKILNSIIGCKMCNGHATPFTEESFKEKCKTMGYEFIGFVDGKYKNGKSKLIYKCNKCGKVVIVNCRNFMMDCYRGCCNKQHHLSSEEYEEKLKAIINENDYELLDVKHKNVKGEFKTTSSITYKCHKCGNVTTTTLGHIVNEGNRCPGCGQGARINSEIIMKRIDERCKELDCTFVRFLNEENEYKNNVTRVLIRCNTCDCEWETSYAHFIRDTGCPKCGGSKLLTNEEATERALEKGKENNITVLGFVDGEYKNNLSRLKLVCNECGYEWDMRYSNFMQDRGCPKCCGNVQPTTEEWVEKARQVHGNAFDYSKTVYAGLKSKVCIICPEHGEFWQWPYAHLMGSGCPYCDGSSLERLVRNFLERNNIAFEQEKSFEWLRYELPMRIDFYLPEYNVGIECQGGQHFKPVAIFEGEEGFKRTVKRDDLKRELCKMHDIKIFYFSNCGIEYPYKVHEDLDELLKEIKEYSYFETMKEVMCGVK